jgi:hypothetical protein
VSWSLRFAEPIVLEGGAKLVTLREAIAHLERTVAKGERDLPAFVTATELLTNAAELSAAYPQPHEREFCYTSTDLLRTNPQAPPQARQAKIGRETHAKPSFASRCRSRPSGGWVSLLAL